MVHNDTGCIVVLFKPDYRALAILVKRLNNCMSTILMIDNSPQEDSVSNQHFVESLSPSVKYISMRMNAGIAAAQNKGILECLKIGFKYVLFLDQDSFMTDVNLNKLYSEFQQITIKDHTAVCIGANPQTGEDINKKPVKVKELISSGSMIKLSAFEFLGMFRDDFFIDFVDYEWCWRARKAQKTIYISQSVSFSHQVGNPPRRMGRIVSAPFRNYYFFRNFWIILKENLIPEKEKRKLILDAIKHIVFEVGICPQRFKRLHYIYRGITDGARNRMGQMIL